MKKIVTSVWQSVSTILLVGQCLNVAVAQQEVCPSSDGVWSGFYADNQLNHIEKVTRPLIEKDFKQLMLTYLTSAEQAKLGKVTLCFPREDGKHPMNFYADRATKTIILPQSSLRFLSDICLAFAYLNRHKLNEGIISQYLSIIRYQWPAIKRKRYLPLDALGIDRAKALSDKDVDSLFGKLYSTALWFILYHELGHILYHHPGNDIADKAKSRQNETQADAFALELLRRVGDPPYGGIVTFFLISQHFTSFVENDKNFQDNATHPLTASRLRAVATNLSRYAPRYAQNQTDPKRFQASYQATADEIRQMADNLANGKFWGLIQAMGQTGTLEQLNIGGPRPASTLAVSPKEPFVGSFSGYWISEQNKLNRMPVQLRLYRREGQIKGTGLIPDPEPTRHSTTAVQWQITNGEIDNDVLYFAWKMGNQNSGIGELKHTQSGLSGWWKRTQQGVEKKLGNLVLTRTP